MKKLLTIVNRDSAPQGFGAAFRQTRPGPEQELVEAFLSEKPFLTPCEFNITIFCEPRIESGFPDLVVVVWDKKVAEKWVPARANLRKQDVKLLHYLYQTGPLTTVELRSRFRVSVSPSISRLEKAALLHQAKDKWKPQPLNKAFAARHILAIEAKISEWARAVHQAFQNTWFATDSYVLLPKEKPTAKIRAAAQPYGVKLCAPGQQLVYQQRNVKHSLPRSYVSWLFNEWAWRLGQM